MPRLLFEKTGNSVWISHLDLMRVFQRVFKRAGLPLKHTQGFNPRPSVSIALPLSVGVESKCELLDFDLEGDTVSCGEISSKLNGQLIQGVKVLDVYESGRKIRDLSLLKCSIVLHYDKGVPINAIEQIDRLFASESVIVQKKTKNGLQDQNIIPMIQQFELNEIDENNLQIEAVICCQNPTLNPAQIPLAISTYLPDIAPNLNRYCRLEVYDNDMTIFR